jgi:hypothetical protein
MKERGDKMIHIVNGNSLANKMKMFNGTVMPWREMYDFGPLMKDIPLEKLILNRSHFFEEKVGIPPTLFIENCQKQNQWLDLLPRNSEIILWFEHDRYDQTMLIYLLHELNEKEFENLSMVTINQYPGVEPFFGLGQLSTHQLEGLLYTARRSITKQQMNEANDGWNAYTSEDPIEIEKWITSSKGHLPFLKKALETHLSYFPSVKNGLNEVENLVFHFINERVCSFTDIFQYISKQRINDGLGDTHFAAILNQLIVGINPLLQRDVPLSNFTHPIPRSNLSLTSFGLEVLKGKSDRFDFVGIDWWLGGVHLQKDQWRWNQQHLIPS